MSSDIRLTRKFRRKSTIIDKLTAQTSRFHFFAYQKDNPVLVDGPDWCRAIPTNREYRHGQTDFSYGDYFSAAVSFLEQNDQEVIRAALSGLRGKDISLDQIHEKNIILEKHGAFYHPSRVELVLPRGAVQLVLNLAVSAPGKKIIDREYTGLKRLREDGMCRHVPAVYGKGTVAAGIGTVSLFLGEWFEGFHEFHLSETFRGDQNIVVWDPGSGNRFLSDQQAAQLYRKAAFILTSCYNPLTFEHVFPWHHAAGDFVVRMDEDQIDLRLITVRGYSPLTRVDGEVTLQTILETLLVFFLMLTIRMRIDRVDGVKNLAWADAVSVLETINGFFEALSAMPEERTGDIPLAECFEVYLLAQDEPSLLAAAGEVVSGYDVQAPEREIIQKNLTSHMETIRNALIHRHII